MTPGPPRSGFITALLLVGGLACLALGLRWYWGHLGRLSQGPLPSASSPPPTPTPRPRASPSGLPAPSPEQIAALGSTNAGTQRKVALALASLRMTPELVQAIRSASPAGESAEEAVQCLKARLPDLTSLDSLIARLPSKDAAIWPENVDESACWVSVLSTRVDEDPQRVVRALLPFALSYPSRLRAPALRAFENARLPEIPSEIQRQLREGWHDSLSIRAAIALRADELAPHLLEDWLRSTDLRIRQSARVTLGRVPRPSAIRLIVRAAAEYPDDQGFVLTLRDRDARTHDVGPVLAAQALDASEPSPVRRRALELLGTVGSAAQLGDLEPLLSDPDPQIRAYAEATAAALSRR